LQRTCPLKYILFSFQRYMPLKLPLICEIVEKGAFWAHRFIGEGIPRISDMRFQITLTSDYMAEYG